MMAEINPENSTSFEPNSEESNGILIPDIESAVEALLFSTADPLTKDQMADAIGAETWMIDEALFGLTNRYASGGGLRIVKVAGGWRMETRPQYAGYVGRLRQEPPKRLSRAALETLSIVAYRQPITGPEIEQIRGVSSDSSVQLLLERGLLHAVGRKRAPGRPILYATTQDFLTQFGLSDLNEMPPLADLGEAAENLPGGDTDLVLPIEDPVSEVAEADAEADADTVCESVSEDVPETEEVE